MPYRGRPVPEGVKPGRPIDRGGSRAAGVGFSQDAKRELWVVSPRVQARSHPQLVIDVS